MLIKCVVLAVDTQVPGATPNKNNKIPTALRDHLLTQQLIITEIVPCQSKVSKKGTVQDCESDMYSETETTICAYWEEKSLLLEGNKDTRSRSSAGPSEQVTGNLTNKKLQQPAPPS